MKLEYFAEGSPDCPLIRLYEFDTTGAKRLREAFRSLADGSRQDIPLHEEWWVQSIAGCHLDLRLGAKDLGIVERLPSKFECVLTPQAWSEVAAMVTPLCSDQTSESALWLNDDGEASLLLSRSGGW
jgi:hypothetical protein